MSKYAIPLHCWRCGLYCGIHICIVQLHLFYDHPGGYLPTVGEVVMKAVKR